MVQVRRGVPMVLSWVWTIIILFSIVFAVYSGQINAVSAATATTIGV